MESQEKSCFGNSLKLSTSSIPSSIQVMSPVTDLTLNLSSLSTGHVSTPRKRLSWSNATPNRINVSQEIEGLENVPKNELTVSKEHKLLQDINEDKSFYNLAVKINDSPFSTVYSRDKENIPGKALNFHSKGRKAKSKNIQDVGGDADDQNCGYSESLSDKDFSLHVVKHIALNTTLHTSEIVDEDSDGFLDVFEIDKLDDEDKSCEIHLPTNMTGLLTKPLSDAKLDYYTSVSNIEPLKPTKEKNERLPIRRCLSMVSELYSKEHVHMREVFADVSTELKEYGRLNSAQITDGSLTSCTSIASLSNAVLTTSSNVSCTEIKGPFTIVKNSNNELNFPHHQEVSAIHSSEQKIAFKRPEPPKDLFSPIQSKRRKSVPFSSHVSESQILIKKKISLQRCYSESEVIMRALQKSYQDPDLIGDFSKPYALPLVKGKHEDLKCISPETVMQLLKGNYSSTVASYSVIDCRYPYEFDAGHIIGAKNIYTEEGILKELLINQNIKSESCRRHIVVFHCEYSSERAPKLCRFLRNKDRETNIYPSLYHPEIYLLNGGYKAFFETFKEYCEPCDYIPMIHKDHGNDLRHFRSKSKSWSSDCKSRLSVRPGLQF